MIGLTLALASVLPDVDAEISESMSELIPDCNGNWPPVRARLS